MDDSPTCYCVPVGIECPIHSCIYCGGAILRPQTDHVWPRSAGGTDEPWNVKFSCGACNASKGSLNVARWIARTIVSPSPDERQRNIGRRLVQGRIDDRLGPWRAEFEIGSGDDPEDHTVLFRSLVDAVRSEAYLEFEAVQHKADQIELRARALFGPTVWGGR
jgi:hypothetical protein